MSEKIVFIFKGIVVRFGFLITLNVRGWMGWDEKKGNKYLVYLNEMFKFKGVIIYNVVIF